MSKTLEFIFDFVSPNAYLAWWPVRDIARRTGATLEVTPVFLGGMHKLTGNAPPFQRRFIAKHGLDKFRMHPQFPFNSVTLQRMLLAVEGERRVALAEALLPAIWEQGVPLDDLGSVLAAAGFDPASLLAATQDPAIKQRLIDNTEHAVERGTFGIPTFHVGSEMFFGKERLGQIEEELAAR
jgi:2-hydroxychromene-2-carboxylate isomerase